MWKSRVIIFLIAAAFSYLAYNLFAGNFLIFRGNTGAFWIGIILGGFATIPVLVALNLLVQSFLTVRIEPDGSIHVDGGHWFWGMLKPAIKNTSFLCLVHWKITFTMWVILAAIALILAMFYGLGNGIWKIATLAYIAGNAVIQEFGLLNILMYSLGVIAGIIFLIWLTKYVLAWIDRSALFRGTYWKHAVKNVCTEIVFD